MPLNKRSSIDLQMTELLLIFLVKMDIFFVNISLVGGTKRECYHSLPARSPDFSPVLYCVWYGLENCLYHGSLNLGYIVWSYFACVRPHREPSAETAKSKSCFSQLSGELLSGEGWSFGHQL